MIRYDFLNAKLEMRSGTPRSAEHAPCFASPWSNTDIEFPMKFNILYYINSNQGLSCKNLENGSDTELISAGSEYYNLDPDVKKVCKDGLRRTKTLRVVAQRSHSYQDGTMQKVSISED